MKKYLQPNGRFALINGRVILPDELVTGKAVVIETNKIAGIIDAGTLSDDLLVIDVGGRYISPGLIDIHTHGAVGHSFNEHSNEAWTAITRKNVSRGVTSLLATITTAPISNMVDCLRFGQNWMASQHDGTQVIGIHVEGPYFSYGHRGAQDPAHLRTPDDGTIDRLLDYHGVIRMMSFAPELPGALDLTTRLVKLGIVAAAGHSSATDQQVQAAMRAGLHHVIHLWSGQSTTTREGPWRKPGLLEATLASDELTAEMITDNKHLPATLMKLAYKCVGPDRLCAISDATNGAGLPEGAHFHMGGMTYDIEDGVAMMLDRSAFAGSTTLLNQMIPILTDVVGVPLVEAVRMASLTPARVIGYDDRKGSLQTGKDADIAIFDEDFTTWRTLIAGEWAYVSES